MKGLVWGSDWFVWFRGFIAGPGGVCGNGGVFRRQLDNFGQTRLSFEARTAVSFWSLGGHTGFSVKIPDVMMRTSAMIIKDLRRRTIKVPRPSRI